MERKVLFFCSETHMGGTETNIISISKELRQRGFEVHIATLEDNGSMFSKCEEFATSLTVIDLFHKVPINSFLKYVRLLKKHKFDVILNFGLRVEIFSRILTPLFSRKSKIISNIRSTDRFRRFYHVWLDMLTHGVVDKWVSNSIAGKNS